MKAASELCNTAHVDKVALDTGCRSHRGTHEVGPAPLSLTAFEVPVRRRGTAFAGFQSIRIHGQAHRATGIAPLESGVAKDKIQAFGLRLAFDQSRTGHDHGEFDVAGHTLADTLDDLGRVP